MTFPVEKKKKKEPALGPQSNIFTQNSLELWTDLSTESMFFRTTLSDVLINVKHGGRQRRNTIHFRSFHEYA